MSESPVIARITSLTIRFNSAQQTAVNDISFELRAGTVTALVGESGSGKSLTARALLGLLPEHATVSVTTCEVPGPAGLTTAPQQRSPDWQRLRGSHIALVPQDALGGLDPLRRIEAEVGDTLRVHQKLTRRQRAPRVINALADAGVPQPEQRARQHPDELSGGLRQRALIAAALIGQADLIIADEPTTALDTHHRDRALEALRVQAARGAAILLITHDLGSARNIADEVLVMKNGHIVERGPTPTVFTRPIHPFTIELLNASLTGRTRNETPPKNTASPKSSIPPDNPAPQPHPAHASALEIRNVTAGYGRTTVLHDVSLQLFTGHTLGLIGASGSGKTTLLRTALGLHTPTQGTVHLNNQLFAPQPGLTGARIQRQLRRNISYVPQDPLATFPRGHTGNQILNDALRAAHTPRIQRATTILKLTTDVGLHPTLLQRPAALLSGGERQRLAIARALANNPTVLLLDEPVSALDLTVQSRILELLIRLQKERHTAYLLVSHDPDVITYLSDHTAHLNNGTITAAACTPDPLNDTQHSPQRPH